MKQTAQEKNTQNKNEHWALNTVFNFSLLNLGGLQNRTRTNTRRQSEKLIVEE